MFKKGHVSYWKGKHFSEETKSKISESNKGKHVSVETKSLMSDSAKKRWESPAFREAMCNSFKGKQVSQETRNKISKTIKRGYRTGEIAVPFKGKRHTEQSRRKISLGHPDSTGEKNPNWGNHHSKETRCKIGKKATERWEDPKYREKHLKALASRRSYSGENNPMYGKKHSEETLRKILKAINAKPNKPEQFLTKLIKEHNLPFRYVGDGQFILGGKCPDFLNYNGHKQLIELYGDYWHRNDDPEERISFFKQYGFDTLVIWEHELNNPLDVTAKIKSFELVEIA